MRLSLLALLAALAIPAPAIAKMRVIAPPGNSGVSQYLETIPTASGSQPSNTVHTGGVGTGGSGPSGGGAAGAATGTSGSGPSGRGGAISAQTQRALARRGSVGRTAAAFALATAPSRSVHGQAHHGRGSRAAATSSASPAGGASPLSSVVRALTGSSGGGGGLGVILPIVLGVSLLLATVTALFRRRQRAEP